jgi:hypothetical protein
MKVVDLVTLYDFQKGYRVFYSTYFAGTSQVTTCDTDTAFLLGTLLKDQLLKKRTKQEIYLTVGDLRSQLSFAKR